MHRMYSLSKTLSKQKIGFWGNLDDSVKSLLSNALNRDIMPSNKNFQLRSISQDNCWMNLRFQEKSNRKIIKKLSQSD